MHIEISDQTVSFWDVLRPHIVKEEKIIGIYIWICGILNLECSKVVTVGKRLEDQYYSHCVDCSHSSLPTGVFD